MWFSLMVLVKFTRVGHLTPVPLTDTHLCCECHESSGAQPAPNCLALYSAWSMLPNVMGFPVFGKLVFVAVDMAIGSLIHAILKRRGASPAAAGSAMALYLCNPLMMNVATRGSADGLVVVLVLGTLLCLLRRQLLLAALLFGLSVHVKIYPIVYALPLVMVLDEAYAPADFAQRVLPAPAKSGFVGQTVGTLRWLAGRYCTPSAWRLEGQEGVVEVGARNKEQHSQAAFQIWQWPDRAVAAFLSLLTPRRLLFGLVSGGVFVGLTAFFYVLYGWEFLYESLLHHFVRADNRHNFSVYFYDLYLKYDMPAARTSAGLLAFLPQFGTLSVLGGLYAKDAPLALFLQTLVFVAFNKVCTAQYFMWWMALLPVVVPNMTMGLPLAVLLSAVWMGTELSWIGAAYHLEWLGVSTFIEVWLASLLFFSANVFVLWCVMRNTTPVPMFAGGSVVPMQSAAKATMAKSE